jgi:hypothetical protein
MTGGGSSPIRRAVGGPPAAESRRRVRAFKAQAAEMRPINAVCGIGENLALPLRPDFIRIA